LATSFDALCSQSWSAANRIAITLWLFRPWSSFFILCPFALIPGGRTSMGIRHPVSRVILGNLRNGEMCRNRDLLILSTRPWMFPPRSVHQQISVALVIE
jgi:hypothetical protein